jgi:hypothetical protein
MTRGTFRIHIWWSHLTPDADNAWHEGVAYSHYASTGRMRRVKVLIRDLGKQLGCYDSSRNEASDERTMSV